MHKFLAVNNPPKPAPKITTFFINIQIITRFINLESNSQIMADVKVYTTSTCPWCVKVKDFLKEHKIKYKEINVAEDYEAGMQMVEKTGQQGVPVTEIDDQFVIGFNVPELKKLLKIKA